MQSRPPPFFTLLGLKTQGDVGPWTMYTSKSGKLIVYLHSPPKKPFTRRQLHQQAKLILIARLWATLTAAEKTTWHLAAQRANLRISGFNVFAYTYLARDPTPAATIERQTGLHLQLPEAQV